MSNEAKPAKPVKPVKEPKQPKVKKELPALTETAAKQLASIDAAGTALVNEVQASQDVPTIHLRNFMVGLSVKLRATFKARKGDANARKKARLEAKLAKIQAEIAKVNAAK